MALHTSLDYTFFHPCWLRQMGAEQYLQELQANYPCPILFNWYADCIHINAHFYSKDFSQSVYGSPLLHAVM